MTAVGLEAESTDDAALCCSSLVLPYVLSGFQFALGSAFPELLSCTAR